MAILLDIIREFSLPPHAGPGLRIRTRLQGYLPTLLARDPRLIDNVVPFLDIRG